MDVGDIKKLEQLTCSPYSILITYHYQGKIDDEMHMKSMDSSWCNSGEVTNSSWKLLMILIEKNSSLARLAKAKSEATTRARTALENEFITQGVATAISRKYRLHEEFSKL